ncbi:heme peroxidase [Mollisia scopiformis]|uniref:Heme peroxidase n=1 Tax=Mollisia scopiformis TaxID=149040 RepID=A0A194XH62_MOLSC|nr:heme peroxidase [Mollisia scopiformis]KUJ19503.1 heme peroxidase [Mollisia scopiformis]
MAKITFLNSILVGVYNGVNALIPWHKLPTFLGVGNLLAYRIVLEAENLYDVYPDASYQGTEATCPMKDSRYVTARNSDGLFNDEAQPMMGCVGMRFGRNVPREHAKKPTDAELLTPSPRLVSDRLLARAEFKPATIVNLLAAAWIQFQVHDWVFHETYAPGENDIEIPLPAGDTWPSGHMKIFRTKPDITLDETDKISPGYKNTSTAWWDASQIYGENEVATTALRGDAVNGKLKMTKEGMEDFLPRDKDNLPMTGFNQNWWLGLELLHTLFALEHNAICDVLHKNNPEWPSDQIFDTARLVNCALMAKIHTTEWTPAILDHPTINSALHANWWGIIGEKIHKMFGRISKNEVIGGIPGSGVNLNGVPYTLTEEFVSVYRLHPLIPDNIAFFKTTSGAHVRTTPIADCVFSKAQDAFNKETDMGDVFYSFGINYPGAITHNNTPNFMRNLVTPDGVLRDISSVDILRDRERGVPRYCEFRRLFHMKAPKTFLDLVGGKEQQALADTLAEIYEDDIEKVDLQVGMFCEPLPKGFGFSDTAFRVFILMASRRIQSDRFLAGDGWTEEVYSKEGMAHVQNETMISVLLRHFPELKPALLGKDNAFRPWIKVGTSADYKGVETLDPAAK